MAEQPVVLGSALKSDHSVQTLRKHYWEGGPGDGGDANTGHFGAAFGRESRALNEETGNDSP